MQLGEREREREGERGREGGREREDGVGVVKTVSNCHSKTITTCLCCMNKIKVRCTILGIFSGMTPLYF